MRELWSYSLSDLLLFSPRVYERLFVLINQDVWPAQIVALALGLGLVWLVLRANPSAGRSGVALTGIAWGLVAIVFFRGRYQDINWVGGTFAAIAGIQAGALLLLAAFGRAGLVARVERPVVFSAGVGLLVMGLLAYPLLAPAFGREISAAQVFGFSPDATAIATLGIAVLLRSRARWMVLAIPVLWCAVTGLTLWLLGRADFFVAPGAALVAIIAAIRPGAVSRRDA